MLSHCFLSMVVSESRISRLAFNGLTMSLVGPGSFLEARKILPLLVEASPEHPSFHVVAVSLPGYGFSEAPKKKGFGATQYAEVGNKLMLALGYNEYGKKILVILHLGPADEFTYQSHRAATGAL